MIIIARYTSRGCRLYEQQQVPRIKESRTDIEIVQDDFTNLIDSHRRMVRIVVSNGSLYTMNYQEEIFAGRKEYIPGTMAHCSGQIIQPRDVELSEEGRHDRSLTLKKWFKRLTNVV